jgi:YD repeat-containing protein
MTPEGPQNRILLRREWSAETDHRPRQRGLENRTQCDGAPDRLRRSVRQETKVEYDGNLNPVRITDRRGKATTYSYDLANQLTEMVRPEGGDWEFEYDARGNRIEVVEPRENATTYDFDLLDRMTEASEPLEVTTEYGYDAGSNLTSVTDPRGNTTSYGYDELGRLTEIDQPLEKTTLYTHDGVGHVLTRRTAAGMLEYEYDAADRLKEVTDGEATLRTFGYDNADRLIAANRRNYL